MGSADRSKKRELLWKKAILHFSLCFVTGFFTGFAPSSTTDNIFSGQAVPTSYRSSELIQLPPAPPGSVDDSTTADSENNLNRSLMTEMTAPSADSKAAAPPVVRASTPEKKPDGEEAHGDEPRRLLIAVTTTRPGDPFKAAFLTRLAHTLKLVPPPLLWVVVESHPEAAETAGMLRMTGIMYRHLVYRENFTGAAGAETDHQRNVALNHIEHHHLDGIVLFADLNNVYDLRLFEEIREIDVFGTWPVASLSANRKRVAIEEPVCRSSQVLGWRRHSKSRDLNAGDVMNDSNRSGGARGIPRKIDVSGFAFNSTILWDPERWGRPSSVPDTQQDSFQFVQQVVLEDESKLTAIPPDCSSVKLWHLHVPRTLFSGAGHLIT